MDEKDLENRFTYHAPETDTQILSYQEIRNSAWIFSKLIDLRCPDSREKSLAITKLEEVVFWANASIARNSEQEIDNGS